MNEDRVTYFAETDARNKRVRFGIKAKDRSKHVYVIGKTGMGKSTLLENMAVQDIQNGEGIVFIDPHGKTAELLLEYIPENRIKDVVYFAPFDLEHPISFNVLESVGPDKRHLVVSGLMSTFKKIWKDAWSARMEYILTNTLLALLEYPDSTLLGVNRMLSEKNFRNDVVAHVTDPAVKAFWTEEFANYTERMAAEAVPAIQNKVGQFTANPLIRNLIGQPKSSFDLRRMMDERKIMIINLSKGKVGDVSANLLGGMLITKIYLAAMSRADIPDRLARSLPDFYLYVDEFQNFANESFADILSEARKYKLNLTVAHQYIEQMEEEVRAAVFGNVGTMITFRVGAYDAEVLEKEFAPQFTAEDLVNLGFTQIYLKLMIDGVSSQPFSATTMGPIKPPAVTHVDEVIATSRKQFAYTRKEVEQKIADWMKPIAKKAPEKAPVSQAPSARPVPQVRPASRPVPSTPPASIVPPMPPIPTVPPVAPPIQPVKQAVKPKPAPPREGESLASLLAKMKTTSSVPAPKPPKPISLDSINASKPARQDAKTPTKENINQLKSALENALGAKGQATANPANNSATNNKANSEVPEDVLRNVLKVE